MDTQSVFSVIFSAIYRSRQIKIHDFIAFFFLRIYYFLLVNLTVSKKFRNTGIIYDKYLDFLGI